MAYNKIVYGGKTLIDLTSDSVTADKVLDGFSFHSADGVVHTGTCGYDSDTSDDTAVVAEILYGKTAHARGTKLTGTMPNRGSVTGTISTKDGSYTIQQGYHDGSGSVSLSETEKSKLKPENIREGVVLLGVSGNMSGSEAEKKQQKTITPTTDGFSVLPDAAFTCLSEVIVNAIPYVETENSAGGITVTIAG